MFPTLWSVHYLGTWEGYRIFQLIGQELCTPPIKGVRNSIPLQYRTVSPIGSPMGNSTSSDPGVSPTPLRFSSNLQQI